MKEFTQLVVSKFKVIWIEVQRIFDHTYRKVFGLPTMRRSMITPQLYVGGQYTEQGLGILLKREFTAIVNLRQTSVEDTAKKHGLRYLHLPTIDQEALALSNVYKGVQFIQDEIDRGGKVYIHCRYGEGRGPSMAIAYLMSTGLTFEDAFHQVQKARSFIRPTPVQIARLKEFEVELKS